MGPKRCSAEGVARCRAWGAGAVGCSEWARGRGRDCPRSHTVRRNKTEKCRCVCRGALALLARLARHATLLPTTLVRTFVPRRAVGLTFVFVAVNEGADNA